MDSNLNLTSATTTQQQHHQQPFGYKEVLLNKLYRAVFASILSQLIVLLLYVFAANIDVFHPIEWMVSSINTFMHISTWLFVLIFTSLIFAQSVICARDYVPMWSYYSTRFQQVLHIFSLHNFILLILHVLVGGVVVWQTLFIVNVSLIKIEKNVHYCIVSDTLFLILSGLFTGIYFFFKVYITSKHLVFPVIQQKKFLRFRSQIAVLFKDSFVLSIWPTTYFALLYYVGGSYLENRFLVTFNLDRVIAERNLFVYLYSWLFSALYIFSMNLMRFLFHLYLTEAVQFPLTKNAPNVLTLQEALVMSDPPIIQHLACLDFFLLSQWSPQRRRFLFELSQPGGHPHNWNRLVESVLKLFSEYTDQMKKSTEHPVLQDTLKKQLPMPVLLPQDMSPELSTVRFRNLRNMCSPTSADDNGFDVVTVCQTNPDNSDLKSLQEALNRKLQKFLNTVRVLFGINYVFGELPQANIQKSLRNGQLIIWASQGIAELLSQSMIEDKYGIVQKDLPILLTTLVHLKQNLDKLNKVAALSRKVASLDDFNYKMKNALSAAVKRSLFHICLNFGPYLQGLSLSKDVMQYLHANILYRN